MTAKNLKVKETGIIKELAFDNKEQRQRMMDLGFLPNVEIKCYAKTYGSTAFVVKESMFGIRNQDAEMIILYK